jgi:hypothetical protein
MARETTWSHTADIGSTHVLTRSITYDERNEVLAWLNHKSRKGFFSYRPHRMQVIQRVTFHITDPNVALEFRLRCS